MPLSLHAARHGSLRIAAHRGFSRHFPENTILAFQKGVDAGANESEIDLMLTRDDKIVVMHDRTLDRTTDGWGFVGDQDLDDILALDAGAKFDPRFAGTRAPTLAEAVAWAKQTDTRLAIEMKERERADRLADVMIETLRDMDAFEHVAISSFDHIDLRRVKEIEPRLQTEAILHHRPVDMINSMRSGGIDGVSLELNYFHRADAEALQEAGIAVRLSLPLPERIAKYWQSGRDPLPMIRRCVKDRLIDGLIGDDVDFLCMLSRSAAELEG
ncbi:glycerophosphodiester phosphodiesterase [Agrobacterium rhizogenes]|uniref:glycerophosphodiester phosphodiesterase n=1 Tax=Rhizobium rhizogenes TaxID=359 RepID=UPI0004D45A42|nr:glycerophosphodiester phosphodiesterase family protein [Rhizobium rhizogenes]KAA6483026.1 glycerophosphodiester phosphodiesterase [Agrobacterium sp. ICMP 7243]OCJ02110.1 glycerophosphodiester phosphodiesterase [Agrobacterium sp. 13-626]OCJ15560.1 glycerophosphodiester phosphodiesterase [Agrobacterium sp. B133/95]KEA09202.1 glycerophosphodiester phosphodiesterase [Rhizobium rhizogenes]MDJ1636544.1 glycerophosphodiester phosphodiesterase family protein [Rhizobium rhizogenes]